jgi:hypothetical protein
VGLFVVPGDDHVIDNVWSSQIVQYQTFFSKLRFSVLWYSFPGLK